MAASALVAVVAWKPLPANRPLVDRWRRLGIPAELLVPAQAAQRLGPADVALVRLDVAGTLDGVEPGLPDLEPLVRQGVRVLNRPHALLIAHDKWRTACRLRQAAIAHPRTFHCTQLDDIRAATLPFVVKPRFGSWGRDVMLCRDREQLERCLATVRGRQWFRRDGALLQQVLASAGHDLRVIVAGQRVVGASRRIAAPGEWRTNEALGGHTVAASPPPDACKLALETARAIGTDLAGVDLLPQAGGRHIVLEVNGAVEFDAIDSLAGRDVYRDIAEALGLLPASGGVGADDHRSRTRVMR